MGSSAAQKDSRQDKIYRDTAWPKGAWLVASLGMKESATQVQDKPESAITHNFQARRARSSCKSTTSVHRQGKLLCTQHPTGRPQRTACTAKDIGCCLLDDLYQIRVIKKDDKTPFYTTDVHESRLIEQRKIASANAVAVATGDIVTAKSAHR